MMGAVAQAVRAGGARTVGVIPQALVHLEVADDDADELVVVPDMRARKAQMDARSDAFVALPGGIGTIEELMEVWTARSLHMHDKPVVLLDPWDDLAPLVELAQSLQRKGFVRPAALAHLLRTSSVEQALDAVEIELAAALR
jgi:uncharacterized protein (TIGR00730 family)